MADSFEARGTVEMLRRHRCGFATTGLDKSSSRSKEVQFAEGAAKPRSVRARLRSAGPRGLAVAATVQVAVAVPVAVPVAAAVAEVAVVQLLGVQPRQVAGQPAGHGAVGVRLVGQHGFDAAFGQLAHEAGAGAGADQRRDAGERPRQAVAAVVEGVAGIEAELFAAGDGTVLDGVDPEATGAAGVAADLLALVAGDGDAHG